MLDYWRMNNIVRPDHRPLMRTRLWVNRVTVQHNNACAPLQDENPTAHQAWTQHLDQHFRDHALQILEDLEAEDQVETDAMSSGVDVTSGSTSLVDTEDEEYAIQTRQESRQLRASLSGSGTYSYISRSLDHFGLRPLWARSIFNCPLLIFGFACFWGPSVL